MGEANRRAIAQGFDDAEHRRLHLSVEAMQREQARRSRNVDNISAAQAAMAVVSGVMAAVMGGNAKRYDRKADEAVTGKYHQELIAKRAMSVEELQSQADACAEMDMSNEPAMRLSSSYSASEEYAKEIAASGNGRLIIEEMSKAEFEVRYPDHEPLVVYDAPTNGNVSIEPGVVYTVATEPLTTKKICAGEYEVTRNRDGAKYRISTLSKGKWDLRGLDDSMSSVHKTLAAAKAAIPA